MTSTRNEKKKLKIALSVLLFHLVSLVLLTVAVEGIILTGLGCFAVFKTCVVIKDAVKKCRKLGSVVKKNHFIMSPEEAKQKFDSPERYENKEVIENAAVAIENHKSLRNLYVGASNVSKDGLIEYFNHNGWNIYDTKQTHAGFYYSLRRIDESCLLEDFDRKISEQNNL